MIQRFLVSGFFALAACGGASATELKSSLPPGDGSFTASPLDSILSITPLGNLNPPEHTVPTDHIYLQVADPFRCPCIGPAKPVYAPGTGTVEWLLPRNPDSRLSIRMTSTFAYYLDHVVLNPDIRVGTKVAAGQKIGMTRDNPTGIDLGVVNDRKTNSGLLVPSRYPIETVHADAPLKYFAEPLRSALYAKVPREGADRDGRIDYDIKGRLSGNWFLDGLPADQSSSGPDGWPKQLAFAYDVFLPSERRISVGGQLARVGTFAVEAGDPSFAAVGPGQRVVYHIGVVGPFSTGPAFPVGLLLVEMQAEDQLRAEMFLSATGTPQFTAAARLYRR